MCASVNDQRSLHGGVYSSGLVYSAATMYFQRVTEWDNFQKCDGYRICEHTISPSMFSAVGQQSAGCPVEDCCVDGMLQSRGNRRG